MTKEVESLLAKTQDLVQRDREAKKDSGEDFNIFSITKIERYENNTHSAMLAELLNPKGSHHQGEVFLKAFLKILLAKVGFDEIEVEAELPKLLSNVRIHKELNLGLRDDEQETGGRVDLVIDTPHRRIFIENKVDSSDQDKQILRYVNAVRNKKDVVFYLTKEGTPASSSSQGDLIAGKDYHLLSYSKDILKWLTDILEHCDNNPYVAQGIKQYLNLVKKITNRLEPRYMIELKNTIKENLVAAEAVNSAYNEAVKEIQISFKKAVKESLVEALTQSQLNNLHVEEKGKEIAIYLGNKNSVPFYFGMESFYAEDGPVYYGIVNRAENQERATALNPKYSKDINCTLLYPICELVLLPENLNVEAEENMYLDLDDKGLLTQLYTDHNFREQIIENTVKQLVVFISANNEKLEQLNQEYAK
ncbi:PDDEXK-like family protein [Leeuwenhoekiella blandensis]|uniref:PD-(D/E)XK nuclease superfamily protein n=1 Tax=Leeuwenhoekiella blandensis (strain CECT 7118 / CCUG 51940 / KCTC 22103 / MED217) TaxID=398720 RepID=A3XPU9_LEEBM|nr:PD-(D/E)XK nuclease family protein [Leeuwenhoekiella blandensis]EAQ48430.1 hypothetical protein MED217_13024 [Leeuwenhoekiella blandensis MED217]